MKAAETPMEIIQELIHIHSDRVGEYQDALSALTKGDHLDLKAIFGELIRESREYQKELQDNLAQMDGTHRLDGRDQAGMVYQAWARTKAAIRGEDSKTILSTCEREVHAVRTAYEKALTAGKTMDAVIRQRVSMQMEDIRDREERIKEYYEAL